MNWKEKKEYMRIAENRIVALKGNPITVQIAANKIWRDFLKVTNCGD